MISPVIFDPDHSFKRYNALCLTKTLFIKVSMVCCSCLVIFYFKEKFCVSHASASHYQDVYCLKRSETFCLRTVDQTVLMPVGFLIERLTKPFERTEKFSKRLTKLFEQTEKSSECVTEPFERINDFSKGLTKSFEWMQIFWNS